jgi:hypothetical protein
MEFHVTEHDLRLARLISLAKKELALVKVTSKIFTIECEREIQREWSKFNQEMGLNYAIQKYDRERIIQIAVFFKVEASSLESLDVDLFDILNWKYIEDMYHLPRSFADFCLTSLEERQWRNMMRAWEMNRMRGVKSYLLKYDPALLTY